VENFTRSLEGSVMTISAKTVVLIAIGAALYGIGGLPMFGIPIFANCTLKPAMAVLALFAILYGPLVGFFVGLIGHWVTDLFAGWGIWFTWELGSGVVGLIMGMYPYLTKFSLERGVFTTKNFVLYGVLAFLSNSLGYGMSAYFDVVLYASPVNKEVAQLVIIAVSNTVVMVVIGRFILNSLAKRKQQSYNLKEAY
jgi:energy-coupling factor transport system substrate-specific component